MAWGVMWETRPGPQIRIDCPRCGASPAIADTEETVEKLLLLGLIPVFKKTTTYVVCTGCGAKMQSKIRLDELPRYLPAQLRPLLSPKVSPWVVVLLALSVMTFCVPVASFVFALVCVVLTMSTPGWPRTLSRAIAVLSGAMSVVFVGVFLLGRGGFNMQWGWRGDWPPPVVGQPARPQVPGERPGQFGDGQALPDLNADAFFPPLPKVLAGDGDAVRWSLVQLKSGPPGFRQFALQRLALVPVEEDRREEVTEAVLPLVSDPDPMVRAAAVEALAVWHTPEALPKLIESAADPDWTVRLAAFRALGKLDDARAAEAVAARLAVIEDRGAAGRALIEMGPAAEDAVLEYVEHADPAVRTEACRVLGSVGTEKSLPKLTPLSQSDDPSVRRRAERAVESIRSRVGS